MEELKFQWDEAKAARNFAKHGVSFLLAVEIFEGPIVERIDDRENYGELRFIVLGRVEFEIYRVVFTSRGPTLLRIISARKASKHEREIYYRDIFS